MKKLKITVLSIQSRVKNQNPFLVEATIREIIIQNTDAKIIPLTKPKHPPKILLILPTKLKENNLLINLESNLTTKNKIIIKISE